MWGKTPSGIHLRNRQKWNHQEHHKKASFFIELSFRIVFLFCFWENVFFTRYVACYAVHVEKRSNSRWQMFFKTGVHKNFGIFTKNTCSLFLTKLQDWSTAFSLKKRLQNRHFPVNVGKFSEKPFYKTAFHYSIPKLCMMIDIRYFRVIFYHCKTGPRNRKNFAI